MSHWFVYWVLMLDNIGNLAQGGVILILIIAAISCYIIMESGGTTQQDIRSLKRLCKILIAPFIIFLMISVFIPTTKQMAAIYLIPKIVANKDIQQLPPKLSKLALEYVNKELDLREKK